MNKFTLVQNSFMILEHGSKIMKLYHTEVKICSYAKTLNIEKSTNFRGCLKLSSHNFIYKEFQLSILWQIKNL